MLAHAGVRATGGGRWLVVLDTVSNDLITVGHIARAPADS